MYQLVVVVAMRELYAALRSEGWEIGGRVPAFNAHADACRTLNIEH